jgi:hypothetical protein
MTMKRGIHATDHADAQAKVEAYLNKMNRKGTVISVNIDPKLTSNQRLQRKVGQEHLYYVTYEVIK